MAKTLAKLFIIMTLVFEGLTIFGMSAFYPVFGIVFGVAVLAVIIYHFIKKMDKKKYIQINVRKAVVA
ncbi:hypothetical protein D6855_11705 [Butyrivibrio sp. CB08]|uniref:hypothetical protein n=1 Tax=Butyrivibrio sp. CB08 TaxID=2364879 RepID=UPI000EA9B73A|nr:hypothetical protein [Butyrivibrio sp. CB08]RKM58819.1 hypothetical protein D6855_11705 [Butyrivibrio sp. CB08]